MTLTVGSLCSGAGDGRDRRAHRQAAGMGAGYCTGSRRDGFRRMNGVVPQQGAAAYRQLLEVMADAAP